MCFQLGEALLLSCPFVPRGTWHVALHMLPMCCMWCALDCTLASGACMSETVCITERRLWKKFHIAPSTVIVIFFHFLYFFCCVILFFYKVLTWFRFNVVYRGNILVCWNSLLFSVGDFLLWGDNLTLVIMSCEKEQAAGKKEKKNPYVLARAGVISTSFFQIGFA